MPLPEKWIIYALIAALLWGASYAASGPILRAGMSALVFFFCYTLFGLVTALAMLLVRGKMGTVWEQVRELGPNTGWFLFSLITISFGAFMTYMAIGEKNATLASLIEISYPFFVVIFSWLFFRDLQLNMMTFLGGCLIVSGVGMILVYAK